MLKSCELIFWLIIQSKIELLLLGLEHPLSDSRRNPIQTQVKTAIWVDGFMIAPESSWKCL